MQIFAHRGFSSRYPENTLLAFEKAIELGAHGIELDVHMAADGIPVVTHDPVLGRTVQSPKGGVALVQSFSSKELASFDAGSWKGAEFSAQRVPTLRKVFELIKNTNLAINVELKNSYQAYPGLEKAVLDLTQEYKLIDRVIISAFDHYCLKRMRELSESIETAVLIGGTLIKSWEYIHSLKAQSLNFNVYCPLPLEDLEELKKQNIKLRCWTVNEPPLIALCRQIGLDAIITDYPDRALEVAR